MKIGITYKTILDLSAGSSRRKLRDLPIPKFVEPVETNPDVTSVFAHPVF